MTSVGPDTENEAEISNPKILKFDDGPCLTAEEEEEEDEDT